MIYGILIIQICILFSKRKDSVIRSVGLIVCLLPIAALENSLEYRGVVIFAIIAVALLFSYLLILGRTRENND